MHKRVLQIVKDGAVVERTCLTCKKMKPLSDFQKDIHGYLQKKARCRDCCNAKQRQIPDLRRMRDDQLLAKYGVTYEQVRKALEDQHGLCANRGCGKEIRLNVPMDVDRAVIDHDHSTGKFRAMLCMMCNLYLGKIEGDQNKILGLLEYLDKHKTGH